MIRLMSIPGVDDRASFAPVTLALAVFAAAVVLGWLGGRVSSTRARWLSGIAWALTIAASILLVVAGGAALAGHGESSVLGTFGGLGVIGLRVDALSGLFLIITFGTGIAAFLAATAGGVLPRYRLSATGGGGDDWCCPYARDRSERSLPFDWRVGASRLCLLHGDWF